MLTDFPAWEPDEDFNTPLQEYKSNNSEVTKSLPNLLEEKSGNVEMIVQRQAATVVLNQQKRQLS